jgi:hypothetical protein
MALARYLCGNCIEEKKRRGGGEKGFFSIFKKITRRMQTIII